MAVAIAVAGGVGSHMLVVLAGVAVALSMKDVLVDVDCRDGPAELATGHLRLRLPWRRHSLSVFLFLLPLLNQKKESNTPPTIETGPDRPR